MHGFISIALPFSILGYDNWNDVLMSWMSYMVRWIFLKAQSGTFYWNCLSFYKDIFNKNSNYQLFVDLLDMYVYINFEDLYVERQEKFFNLCKLSL